MTDLTLETLRQIDWTQVLLDIGKGLLAVAVVIAGVVVVFVLGGGWWRHWPRWWKWERPPGPLLQSCWAAVPWPPLLDGRMDEAKMSAQEYQRMQAYARIAKQVDFIEGVTPEGLVLVRLGLICTVYFRNGGQRDMGYKVLGCFDRFVEQFGEHLQGQFHSLSGRSFTSLRKDSIVKARVKLQELIDEGAMFSWDLQSEKRRRWLLNTISRR